MPFGRNTYAIAKPRDIYTMTKIDEAIIEKASIEDAEEILQLQKHIFVACGGPPAAHQAEDFA